jgi:hypothetical protein
VNDHGLCANCARMIGLEVSQRLRVLKESVALVENGRSPSTRLSRCDLVISQAQALAKYEARGIAVLSVHPSQIAKEYGGRRMTLVLDGLRTECDEAK